MTFAAAPAALADKDEGSGGGMGGDGKKSDAKDRRAGGKGDKEEPDNDDDETLAEKAGERFPQPVVAGTLLHRAVLEPLESQPVLGHVSGLVRTRDGTLKVVVNTGGFLGFRTRPVAVPLDAMTLLGDDMELVDFTPTQLRTFPTFDEADGTPVPSDQVVRVGLSRPSH